MEVWEFFSMAHRLGCFFSCSDYLAIIGRSGLHAGLGFSVGRMGSCVRVFLLFCLGVPYT